MPKKGLTIWCRSCKILNVRRELITHARTDREASNITPFTRFRACRKGPKNRAVSGVGTGGSIALFTALQHDSAICSRSAGTSVRSGASFFPRPQTEAQRSGFGLERKKEGAERASSDVERPWPIRYWHGTSTPTPAKAGNSKLGG